MEIRLLTHSDRIKWQDWVFFYPGATLYHRIEWKDVIEKSFNHETFYLFAIEHGNIKGILPLVHIKSHLFGNMLCSMPFLNFGGICADDIETERALLDAARELLKKNRGDYLELRHQHKTGQDLPVKTHKVSMTIELERDPKVLWGRLKTKQRTTIRRSLKFGLTIRFGGVELLDPFYEILSIGWRNHGTPIYHRNFFREAFNRFGAAIEVCVVYYENKPIAAAAYGKFKDTVEGMWTYSLREYAHLETNYFLYWKMIEKACLDGFRHFHLGRSTNDTGATFFKSKWNAVPQQLYWEYILNGKKEMPDLSVDNPRFKLAQETWRRMPVSLTNLIGPWIARFIP